MKVLISLDNQQVKSEAARVQIGHKLQDLGVKGLNLDMLKNLGVASADLPVETISVEGLLNLPEVKAVEPAGTQAIMQIAPFTVPQASSQTRMTSHVVGSDLVSSDLVNSDLVSSIPVKPKPKRGY